MNSDELTRKLNSVGKQAFVDHYDLFERYAFGLLSRDQVVDELVRLGISNEAGASIRIGNAKLIFEARKEMDAIELILNSERIPLSTHEAARKLQK